MAAGCQPLSKFARVFADTRKLRRKIDADDEKAHRFSRRVFDPLASWPVEEGHQAEEVHQ